MDNLVIPLAFWYNRDPRLALPIVRIPYGEIYINIALSNDKLKAIFEDNEDNEITQD